jgi:hypothetical protein
VKERIEFLRSSSWPIDPIVCAPISALGTRGVSTGHRRCGYM